MASSDHPAGGDPGPPAVAAAARRESPADSDPDERFFAKALLEAAPVGIWVLDESGRVLFHNELFSRLFGLTPELLQSRDPQAILGHVATQLVDPEALWKLARNVSDQREPLHATLEFRDGQVFALHVQALRRDDETLGRIWQLRDITEELRSQEALKLSEANLRSVVLEQERLIATIREIGTPVLPIYNRILVLPIVGHMESSRSEHLMDALLEAIQRHQASVVIIDITGVSLVDTSVANSLIQSMQAAGLLGAHCVLVGISAAVARTIVQLGVDLSLVTTRRDLQAGIAFALQSIGYAITVTKEEPDWLSELDLGDGNDTPARHATRS